MSEKVKEAALEVLKLAESLFKQDPDWVLFFREILGIEGAARKVFATSAGYSEFEQTEEFNQIQILLAKLRDRSQNKPEFQDATRVITVRMPRSLHDSLRREAHHRRTSMNQLCISKLLQVIDEELIPSVE